MAQVKRRYSKEEIARRGNEIYERKIQPTLKASDKGKLVAIDIETAEYEIADDELVACDRLRERVPQAQNWLLRVGSPYLHRFSACSTSTKPPSFGTVASVFRKGAIAERQPRPQPARRFR